MAFTYKGKPKVIEPYRAGNGKTETLSSIKTRTGATHIINGGYYTTKTGKPESWLMIDGKVLANGYNGFGYSVDGEKVAYSYQNNVNYPHFIGGVFRLVHNGKIDMIGGETNKRGRTAMGLTALGETIFYVVPDNDTKNRLTSRQLAEKMLSLGCVNAIELDGGGSSQFSSPTGQYSSGRAVSWWICIWVEGEPVVNMSRPVLRLKSRGIYVEEIQKILKLKVDGSFGTITETAVKSFQRSNGLVADGSVGPATWSKLLNQGTPVVKVCPCCGQEVK